MRIADIIEGTSVDGPGLRTAIYFQGCSHRCPGCHNPSTWPIDEGRDVSVAELVQAVEDSGSRKVTFTGGDPFYQAASIAPLALALKAGGCSVWCYTGFTFEQIIGGEAPEGARALLEAIDVLVDGQFVEALRDTKLRFRGSSNQRLIDVPASLATAKIVEWSL